MVVRRTMRCRSAPMRGFTLVELSVVLVIIAVILGAVTSGGDLLRQASGQRIFSEFVTGWRNAFSTYTTQAKVVPGDNPIAPTNVIHGLGGSSELCNDAVDKTLTNVMLSQSIEPPEGRGTGEEDRFVYLDSNGSPHELRVCFTTVQWAVSGTTSGTFVKASRHVMHLTGLTTELAMQFDALIDGRLDARFGRFRQTSFADSLSATGVEWPLPKSGTGEDNIPEVDAYLVMD
ncbi:MAG: prepilin-type N-terminal cleavage/methylation domain-containing protein [Variovorax sp.]|nr:MAG: prepilin-type N-terminal cleavage/methylation domain-containing protein [Variovorax sp.]